MSRVDFQDGPAASAGNIGSGGVTQHVTPADTSPSRTVVLERSDGAKVFAEVESTRPPSRISGWISAYGRGVILCGVVVGLFLPGVAHFLRPYLSYFLIAVLALSIAQVDPKQVRRYARHGGMVAGLMFLLLVLSPAFIALQAKVVLVPYGLPPEIADGMILASLAPPLLAAPAIASLLGLDSVLALLVSLAGHLAAPLAISVLAPTLLGPHLQIGEVELMVSLALIIGPGLALGFLLRKAPMPGPSAEYRRPALDLLSVLALVLLAIAITAGVSEMAIEDPYFMLWAIPVAFLLNPLLQLIGASMFVRSGYRTSLTVGLLAGYRNVGLLVAVLAASGSERLLAFLSIVTVCAFVIPVLSGPVLYKVRTIGFDLD